MPVIVRFNWTEFDWNKVVIDADMENEAPYVSTERMEYFEVEYETEQHFANAVARFDGMVDFNRIS